MAKTTPQIQLLLVESHRSDRQHLRAALAHSSDGLFSLTQVPTLSAALAALRDRSFDLVLLDLDLPDSGGAETFVALHRDAPRVPVLVVVTADTEARGVQAVEDGAQGYLLKSDLATPLATISIRYAVEHARRRSELAEEMQRQQARELLGIDRLSRNTRTAATSKIYASPPLRESAPDQFQGLVHDYGQLLEHAVESQTFKGVADASEGVRELAERLGLQRATPRDVIDIYSTALKDKTAEGPWQRANAYLAAGRLLALELMGYLASFYRSYYPGRQIGR